MMTVRQLIAEVRKPGEVALPVLVPGDVTHIIVKKADLLAYLTHLPGGVIDLDVQD